MPPMSRQLEGMTVGAVAVGAAGRQEVAAQPWLRSAPWDLSLLVSSVILAVIPYSIYVALGGSALEEASIKGTTAYQARVLVNLLVTAFIAGPHMYATFTGTLLDPDYVRRHLGLLAISAVIPVSVIAAAVVSYESYVWLLTVFFGLASVHALHQIVWLSQAYNRRARVATSLPSRLIDYAVVFTSLYPVAVAKMVRGEFRIGPVYLEYNHLIYGWFWFADLVALAFGVSLALFVAKTILELRAGYLNVPKTVLIAVTVPVMLTLPAFPNMDTSFQGANAWHSFQYLALTWYANRLREKVTGKQVGFLHWLPSKEILSGTWFRLSRRLVSADRGSGWTTYYLVCFSLVPVSGILIVLASLIWPKLHAGQPGADEVYRYMIVLSALLVHYFQDTFLFTDAEAIIDSGGAAEPGLCESRALLPGQTDVVRP
jgi:hypothetical protein